jgi:hypothetical protein
MAATFKVGDKVVNEIFGAGEIVYGPYGDDRTSYFMKAEDGLHHTVTGSLLSPAAKFKVGDTARGVVSGQEYTIEGGPFFGPVEWYAAKRGDGTVTNLNATQLRPVEPTPTISGFASSSLKVGDVVRILHDDADGADVKAGDLLAVKIVGAFGKVRVHAAPGARMSSWYIGGSNYAKVPAVEVAVHDGVVYDLSAKYKDTDGDAWKFERIGDEVRGNYTSRRVEEWDETLAAVVRSYGPLTRV